MNEKKVYQEFYTRLSMEGWIRALNCGITGGSIPTLTIAMISFFGGNVSYSVLWAVLAFVVSVLILTPAFYFLKFKPTPKSIARRLDSLGLEERLLTMNEMENDDSYIAFRQRQNALDIMRRLPVSTVKIQVPLALLIATPMCFVASASMTTVAGLSEAGIIRGGDEVLEEIIPSLKEEELKSFTVSYVVEQGGYIEGESEQIVILGDPAEPILAVADDGWMFDSWDDGWGDPAREDEDITENVVYTAVFVPVEEGGEGEAGDGDGDPGEPGENGDDGDPGDNPGPGAGGKYEEYNQIIDGETYYRDVLKEYYDAAMEILAAGGEIPAELKQIIETYYGVIL